MKKKYISALKSEIIKWGGSIDRPIDSIYIGGGTPSLLGKDISDILNTVYSSFKVKEDCEITAEVNPDSDISEFLYTARQCGVNRLSIGVQSGIDSELKALGRTHTADQAKATVFSARNMGFDNISLDLIICQPNSNVSSLNKSLSFLCDLKPDHISSYILKIEPNTKLGLCEGLPLPDEDAQAEQYLYMCRYLEEKGFEHYEISNFAKKGRRSRHNMKYWTLGEYLGLGPSAHSFLNGERFFYPRDLKGFIQRPQTVSDGTGGENDEKLMLALRLKDGINISEYTTKPAPALLRLLNNLQKAGYIELNLPFFSLTDSGMLVSNSIITEITELLYENL